MRLATLLHKPDFKQNYLTPIRSLSKADQCALLQQVIDHGLSLSELQVEANKIKQQSALKTAFVKLTNVESLEEARKKFPHFATEQQLEQYIHIDLKNSIPKPFPTSAIMQRVVHLKLQHQAQLLSERVQQVCLSAWLPN